LSGLNPLFHFAKFGRYEGRKPSISSSGFNEEDRFHKIIPVGTSNNPILPSIVLDEESDFSLEVPFNFVFNIECPKIAVIIHIFYPEMTSEIVKYLKNIPCNFDLYISTNTIEKQKEIKKAIADNFSEKIEIRVFENRGRDIAPKIVGFADVYDNYEVFLHLHSKKSPHYPSGGLAVWREYLLENLLGSPAIVRAILYLLVRRKTGIVYAQHLSVLKENELIDWAYDFEIAKELLSRVGFSLTSQHLLEFPSGSMFWGKTEAIRPLLNLNLQFQDFPPESGQIDGTIAHAIERSFLYFCEISGHRWAKISTGQKYPKTSPILKTDSEGALQNAIKQVYRPLLFPSNINHGQMASLSVVPMFNMYPDQNVRQRINLVVPTINPEEVFGGVATALRFFWDLFDVCHEKIDFRIIVTNAKFSSSAKKQYSQHKMMTLSETEPDEQSGRVIILDASFPLAGYLSTRKEDIFIATVWWTASTSYAAIDFQKQYFKKGHKLVYLIQDFEPSFYPWSSKWVLTEATYRRGNETIAVFNSEEFANYMLAKYSFHKFYFIPYEINRKIKENFVQTTKKKQILIYGRPSVARNAFEIIVDSLYIWQQENPISSKQWEIISLGESYDPSAVNQLKNINVLGKVSLEHYSRLLSESLIGISLMISYHPSYPPLEMASFGIHTITNSFEYKSLAKRSPFIIDVDSVTPELIAQELQKIAVFYETNPLPKALLHDIQDIQLNQAVQRFDPMEFCELLKEI